MIKKMLAGPMVAGAALLSTAGMAETQEPQTTPPAEAATSEADDDDDDGGKVGLLGLLGLAGLAGLAGLKRRDHAVSRYQNMPTQPR